MNDLLTLFLPCAAGVEGLLADEVAGLLAKHWAKHCADETPASAVQAQRGGVRVQGPWRLALLLNLHSRLAQRVLVQVAHAPYVQEDDLYAAASAVPWEDWFAVQQTFKIDATAQRCPLKSLNFAALRIKDAVADCFRARAGSRPSVDAQRPGVRIHAHLDAQHCTLYIDTSGEPLFKRGWREDKGDAPLKETLAAAMLAASGWQPDSGQPLYDPCCGSGTIVIEAAQMACRMAPGRQRRFAFERLLPYQPAPWQQLLQAALAAEIVPPEVTIFGSDVAHRMVDFAQRNAERAGVARAVQLRGGDALQRMPPSAVPGVLLLNPPYGERIAAAGVAGRDALARRAQQASSRSAGRERAVITGAAADDGAADFFERLAQHWKRHYPGWTAWLLSPDMKLPQRMRLQAARRVPLWNGPLECRLFRFDMVAGRLPKQGPMCVGGGESGAGAEAASASGSTAAACAMPRPAAQGPGA
ncbi:MAG: THUMP domain-containing protein [Brachymonas sp.]|nr:THUMP domain-containing protein [Brachymonas sp.]